MFFVAIAAAVYSAVAAIAGALFGAGALMTTLLIVEGLGVVAVFYALFGLFLVRYLLRKRRARGAVADASLS